MTDSLPSKDEVVEAQIREILDMESRGAHAIALLATARTLMAVLIQGKGIDGDSIRSFIERVDALMGPIVGPSTTDENAVESEKPLLTCRIKPGVTTGDELIVDAKDLLRFLPKYRVIPAPETSGDAFK